MAVESSAPGPVRTPGRAARALARLWPGSVDPLVRADAAFAAWLSLIAINALFLRLWPLRLDPPHALLHHAYDAGQLLGLAALSWLLVYALFRLPLAPRAAAAVAGLLAASYAALGGDLESFLTRHPQHPIAWRLSFAGILTLAIAGAALFGALLAPTRLRWLGLVLGACAVVANHRVLPLAYPAMHLALACSAAALIAGAAQSWAASWRPSRRLRACAVAASALSLLSFAIVPGAVVRSALLRSSGAVVAPFLARAWAQRRSGAPQLAAQATAWFRPRVGLPSVPAERLPGAPRAPIVVLITIDALRADVLETRSAKSSVPNLLQMAKSAARFDRTWAAAPYTMASLRSLFFGAYYLQQPGGGPGRLRRAAGQRSKVRSGPFLAEVLARRDVRTLNVKSLRALSRKNLICRGFRDEVAVKDHATSEQVVSALLERLPASAEGPLFVYAHIFDPHAPYTLGGGTGGSSKRRYLREVAYVDARIGKLRRALRERGLDHRTYLIVTADHAEAFGEHGHDFHATTVYEEMIRIPLLIEGPGIAPRRVKRPVSLIDVGPTVLSLFGASTPGRFMGQSLVPFLRGEDPVLARPLAVDGGRAIRAMLFEERWKAIVDVPQGTEEVYDLKNDPGERQNLAEQPEARVYLDTLYAFFAGINPKKK